MTTARGARGSRREARLPCPSAALLLLALGQALGLSACAAPAAPGSCSLSPEQVEAGAPLDLTLRIEGLDRSGQLRMVLPHPWYALRGAELDESTVSGSVDGQEQPGHWLSLEHGHRHAVVDGVEGSEVELQVRGLRAPTVEGVFEPVLLFGSPRRLHRICEGLQLSTRPGSTAALQVTAPTTAAPGGSMSLGLLFGDRHGNPAEAATEAPELGWIHVGESRETIRLSPAPPPSGAAARWEVPAPPAGLWIAEVRAGPWSARSNAVLVEAGAPRELWADLHGHGALSDGWRPPREWFEHARDVAFLDAAALSEHSWQLTAPEWAELVSATDAAQVPERFATLSAMEVNVVGHEIAYLLEGDQLAGAGVGRGATTIWEETDLGRQSAALRPSPRSWVRDEGVIVVPHTSLHPTMGAELPSSRLGTLGLVEVYSAHGSSMERGGWRSLDSPEERGGSSVLELLQDGEQLGFLAAGDSHDGRPGTSGWGRWPGGLTAVRSPTLDRSGLWEGLVHRRTVASSARRVHADASLSGRPFGSHAEPGILRYRVADSEAPLRLLLHRDGRLEAELPVPAPGAWAEFTVEGSFRSLHLEVVLHDAERLWLSPWLGQEQAP